MKKLLIVAGYYEPSIKAGGPVQSIKNLVEEISSEFEIYILAIDRDIGDTDKFNNIDYGVWYRNRKNVSIQYIKRNIFSWKVIREIHKALKPDVLYFNSFFDGYLTLLPILFYRKKITKNTKLYVSPRGQLSYGAMSKKTIKKKIYVFFYRMFRLFQYFQFHFTTDYEVKQARRYIDLKDYGFLVANNLINSDMLQKKYKPIEKKQNSLRLVYISRIHPKKNLLLSLDLLKDVDFDVSLDIYGPLEDEIYWENCMKAITKLPKNITVKYLGVLNRDKIANVLSHSHFLYFLTKDENFGHVIAEALSVGCPIIISNNTPWTKIEEKSCGWEIDLNNLDRVKDIMSKCYKLDQNEYNVMSKNAYEYLRDELNVKVIVNKYIDSFSKD